MTLLLVLQDRGSGIGKLEPISPVSPVHMDPDLDLVPARFSKEELIQNMDRVDREITMVEQQISKLRKKQVGTATPARTPPPPGVWFAHSLQRNASVALSNAHIQVAL